MQNRQLDASLALRSATWEDLNAVVQLIYEVCEADGDTSVAVTPEELAQEWNYEGFSPEKDTFLVADGGQVVGYIQLDDIKDHCDLRGDMYIHPQYLGRGIGPALVQAMEIRAEEHSQLAPEGRRVTIRAAIDHKDEYGKMVFSEAGYAAVRYYWRMEIVLEAEPQVSALPQGLEVKPFVQEDHARAVWQARNDAFQDHWGSHELSFEDFAYLNFENPDYDPDLWTVIWAGEEVAAFCINRFKMGIGWVQTLGVRRAWRKMGLGLRMLEVSFGQFWQRGMKTVGLTVDAANPTGATRLYQKAGMHAVSEFVLMKKELRAGEEE